MHWRQFIQRYESTLRAVILGVLHEEGETDDVHALGTVKTRLYLAQKKLLNRLVPNQNKI
jgi:hypothetical protein